MMGKLIDADVLERDGWRMSRIVQIDEKTMELQTRKPTDFPTVEPQPEPYKGEMNRMGDLIDRQAAIDAILHLANSQSVRGLYEYTQEHNLSDMWSGGVNDAIDAVIAVPSVQPERKTGRWIPQSFNKSNGMITTAVYYYPKCSVCGWTSNNTNFCPNCGADMRGEE